MAEAAEGGLCLIHLWTDSGEQVGMVKFKLVVEGVSAGASPSGSPEDDWWVWGEASCPLLARGQNLALFFLIDWGLSDSDIFCQKKQACVFL